jgi:glycosyltransferase involved in cell wall biosynthesis
LVVSLHGDDVERFSNGAQPNGWRGDLPALRAILKSADAVTAVSRDLLDKAKQVEPQIANKSHVIHNGIDLIRFTETARHDHPRPYWLALGRFVHKKGFDLLIEAFSRYDTEHRPDLIIAGSGEERGALQEQVERLGLNEKIHFFGPASDVEVVKLMNGSIGVVVPSRHEPFGIVALEACAAGKPVVATKTGGLQELARRLSNSAGENGRKSILLVEPTAAGLADGLQMMLRQKNTARSAMNLPSEFDWQTVGAKYENLLCGNEMENGH